MGVAKMFDIGDTEHGNGVKPIRFDVVHLFEGGDQEPLGSWMGM